MRAFTVLVICGAGAGSTGTHALLRGSRHQLDNPLVGLLGKRQKDGGGYAQSLSHVLDAGLGSWVSQQKLSQTKRMRHDAKLLARQIQAVSGHLTQLTRQMKELAFARMFQNNKQEIASKGKEVQRLKRMRRRFRAQQAELIDALHAFK